ncbi:MAG: patatin-like phospholipase family protein [Muribaculum sp.]|nr:patatin-like phospholipase family protein [Muribaculaceae bacterium]MCM1080664.1 patatin-like phospholipase family protein [Muribaculum sp.]
MKQLAGNILSATAECHHIGLALSGGGVRGIAHLGALYAMDELGIKPDIIAGVSSGAIAAAFYASGMKPLEILKLFMIAKFSDFCEISMPRNGLLNMNGFKSFLKKYMPVEKIEQCPLPVVLCATDLDSGTAVQWRKGNIVERVVASCSIPIVFKPMKIGGTNYVDGGVLHNLPAWAIREECDHLIGINVSPLIKNRVPTSSILDVAQRSYHLLARMNAVSDLALCDTVISTDTIADLQVFNMKEKERIFKSGYKSARQAFANSPLVTNNKQ